MAKKLIYRNIFGKPTKIKGDEGNGVIIVNTLPDTGEEGKIYYNQYDYSYYIYNGEFEKISKDSIEVITDIDEVPTARKAPGSSITPPANSYILLENVFYNIENWNREEDSENDAYMVFIMGLNGEDGVYAGRFTAWVDDINITWSHPEYDIVTPDNVDTTIVNGHTYEFNVWQGVLILVDVTSTEQGGE